MESNWKWTSTPLTDEKMFFEPGCNLRFVYLKCENGLVNILTFESMGLFNFWEVWKSASIGSPRRHGNISGFIYLTGSFLLVSLPHSLMADREREGDRKTELLICCLILSLDRQLSFSNSYQSVTNGFRVTSPKDALWARYQLKIQ